LNNPTNFDDRRPLRVKAAPKWSGSVEDGIAWLRSLEAIIIHPDCKYALYEVPRYSWKVDKLTGDLLPVPAEGNDHIPDAIRYACHKHIKKKFTIYDVI
jgi:phage terminase large subunit